MNILSKYLAPWAIPKENIPLNIVWDPNENIQEITLTKPEFLLIKEVFNANYIVENELKVKFYNFDSDGYFSAELVSKEIDDIEKECNIILEFRKNEIAIERIKLFTRILRAKLKSTLVPKEINISEVGGEFKVNNPIKLQYRGFGRVFVHVKTLENSALQIDIPAEIKDVLTKFSVDFKVCLNELKLKYPQYEKLLTSLEFEDLSLNDMESELELYSETFENDVNFTTDFSEKFAWAVSRNYALLDDYIITPFIEYIRSAPIRTVHLVNPIWRINFSEVPKLLNLKIEYFDLKENMYEPIEISTKLVGDRDGSIDLYKLFDWELA